MNENLDLTKVLKVGDKVYSPMFSDCKVIDIDSNAEGWCISVGNDNYYEQFLKDGKYARNGECLLFPSKDNRDWSTFRRAKTYEDIVNKTCIGVDSHYPMFVKDSEKQIAKLTAINKLLNVAKYLNDGWKPDWSDTKEKYFITLEGNEPPRVARCYVAHSHPCHFETEEFAQQAIDILGEETIKTALGDY